MKILQILPSLQVGGVERGVIDIVRGLKQRGHESVVISSGGELVAELQKMGITHYEFPVHKKSLFSLGLVGRIVEVIRRERVDIVHARSRVPAWLAWFAACRARVPFVTTCHGYYSVHPFSSIMGWGQRVIAISQVIGRHMIDDFGVSPERIRLIHRGVDLSQFSFRPKVITGPKNTAKTPFRILNVGRLSPIKGQLEFLKAIYRLKQELPQIEGRLVGSEGKGKHKYTDEIRKTIRQLGLEKNVKLLGTRRDIPELLQQADLLVLSTLVPEGFGRVVVEAGAVGVPVIATRLGGVLDIIEDGENGLLVAPGDTEGMAQAMFSVLSDRSRAQQFAVKLREKVEKFFTLDRMAEETIKVYEEAKKRKKILVLKLGAAGDVILAVPSLRMIRDRFPDSYLAVLVDRNLACLLSNSPYIDEVIPIDRRRLSEASYLLKTAKRLRREGFDLSVDLQNSKWTHLVSALSGIPERFGFRRGGFGFLLTTSDPSFHVKEPPVKHQFRILSKLGVRKFEEALELWPDPASEERFESLLPRSESEKIRYVGLVMGSSPQWPTKRWPVESFQGLAERLIRECRCRIVLIGSGEDRVLAENFTEDSENILNFLGKTSLVDLISLIKRLDVLVTGDTAPLHVAGAMKTKIVALFGPTDPKPHMPPGNGAIVFVRSLACRPCYQGKCRNPDELACLRRISVQEIFQAVRTQLGLAPKSPRKQEFAAALSPSVSTPKETESQETPE